MTNKGEYVTFKNYEGKIKQPFMIDADLENILLPEDSGKQNSEEPWGNKCQKHISCSYGYKLVCVDHKFSKPFRSYLGKYVVYNLIESRLSPSKINVLFASKRWEMMSPLKNMRNAFNFILKAPFVLKIFNDHDFFVI